MAMADFSYVHTEGGKVARPDWMIDGDTSRVSATDMFASRQVITGNFVDFIDSSLPINMLHAHGLSL